MQVDWDRGSVQALVVVEVEVEAPPLPTLPGIALAAVEGKGTRFPLCARASSPSRPSLHKGIKLPPDKFYLHYYTYCRKEKIVLAFCGSMLDVS